jgi:hypothetical protein
LHAFQRNSIEQILFHVLKLVQQRFLQLQLLRFENELISLLNSITGRKLGPLALLGRKTFRLENDRVF